jgi:hypothetical protein
LKNHFQKKETLGANSDLSYSLPVSVGLTFSAGVNEVNRLPEEFDRIFSVLGIKFANTYAIF